ncbi:MAG: malonyl-ACP O-methyltransferase BioC [Steroidobacteraceae bacterium]
MSDEFFLDQRLVRRAFDRASVTYDRAAVVQAEIRGRLLERLDLVRLRPSAVLDLGAGTGHASRALKRRYPAAQVIAVDLSLGMLQESRRQQGWRHRFQPLAADAHKLPIRSASVDLVLSNLMLEWCQDPDAVFAEIRRVLRPQGLLMFTTLGPDTLKELRDAWRRADRHTHVHRFIDMHDIGDALVRAGLAEPVMDTERLTITYPSLPALVEELRASGSTNIAHGRARGLTGKRRAQDFQTVGRNGALAVSVEAVYGHAWAGAVREQQREGGEVRVPVTAIRPRRS